MQAKSLLFNLSSSVVYVIFFLASWWMTGFFSADFRSFHNCSGSGNISGQITMPWGSIKICRKYLVYDDLVKGLGAGTQPWTSAEDSHKFWCGSRSESRQTFKADPEQAMLRTIYGKISSFILQQECLTMHNYTNRKAVIVTWWYENRSCFLIRRKTRTKNAH